MTATLGHFLVLHEPEAACRARLTHAGTDPEVAAEIAFYLAQGGDFERMRTEVAAALAPIGVELVWADLDDHEHWLPLLQGAERTRTLLWSLTDGFKWYRGSHASSLAALLDVAQFGSPPPAQHLCQDKFRCLVLAAGLGLRVPPSMLVEDDAPLSPVAALPPDGPYFVKPNTLGAKLGIAGDSRASTLPEAIALSRRIWRRYGDHALIQAYVPGRDVRVSFMDLSESAAPLGIQAISTSGATGFPTLEESRLMTRLAAAGTAGGLQVGIEDLAGTPEAERIAGAAWQLARIVPLRDYFSLDFRLAPDGTPWFLEFEVCPAVTIYDFRTYLRATYGLDLPEALARAAPLAFARRQERAIL